VTGCVPPVTVSSPSPTGCPQASHTTRAWNSAPQVCSKMAVGFTFEQWNYAFTNGFPEDEARALYERYHIPASAEVKEFEGPHLLPAWPGWEQVADYALDWALRHSGEASRA
jgi:hypothetical protein